MLHHHLTNAAHIVVIIVDMVDRLLSAAEIVSNLVNLLRPVILRMWA